MLNLSLASVRSFTKRAGNQTYASLWDNYCCVTVWDFHPVPLNTVYYLITFLITPKFFPAKSRTTSVCCIPNLRNRLQVMISIQQRFGLLSRYHMIPMKNRRIANSAIHLTSQLSAVLLTRTLLPRKRMPQPSRLSPMTDFRQRASSIGCTQRRYRS